MALAPPQKKQETKLVKSKPEKLVAAGPALEASEEKVSLPSWRALAATKAATPEVASTRATVDGPEAERESRLDAARTTGLTEGKPGPKSRSALKEKEGEREQAESEGRVPTAADAAEADVAEREAPTGTETAINTDLPALRRGRGPPGAMTLARSAIASSEGTTLTEPVLAAFASGWGENFASVVIHTDDGAAHAAALLAADAFTIGEHVYFARGHFDPHAPQGLALLAHELAHVVQYRSGALDGLRGVSDTASPVERAADAFVQRWGVPCENARGPPPSGQRTSANEPVESAPVLRRATDGAKAFLGQGYFQQAAGWGDATTSLDSELGADAAADAATFPSPSVAVGPVEPAVAPAVEPAPALTLEGEVPMPEAGASEAFSLDEPGAAADPAFPALGALNAGADGDTSAAQARLDNAIDGVPTEFEVATSPGEPPAVELPGACDPAQTEEQVAAASEQATALHAQAASAVAQGPGGEQVQPTSCHETQVVPEPEPTTLEPLGSIPEMDTMQANPIPDDVKAATDAEGQEQLTATVSEANASFDTAAADHDAARQEEVTKAETEQTRVNQEANAEQARTVTAARAEIDAGRSETLTEQEAALAELDTQSAEERSRVEGDIDSRVQEDERAIDAEYQTAEADAAAEKSAKEQEARQEKDEADRSSDNDSWWDRALDAVASFFDALLEAVNAIFDALVQAVGAIIEAAKAAVVAIIDAIRDFAIAMIRELGELLKDLVNALLADIFPELAAALNELIDAAVDAAVAAVTWLAEQAKAGILALLDSIGAALNQLLEAWRAAISAALQIAKAALTGDWAALGRLILEAALNLVGIPPESFYEVAASAMSSIDIILADPGTFCNTVISALAGGFESFGSNILTHLQEGFFAWIVGPLGELGITLPSNWDLPGIFGLVLQVLGLTREGIRQVITEELGETAGMIFDFVWRYVGALIEGGLQGLWEQIQSDLGMLWNMVIDGIKNWLIETVVTQAIIRVATMFNPAGALLNVLVTVYNVVMWLRENVQRIWGVVQAVVGMLGTLAAGDAGPAAAAIEAALASLVPIAISLLANLLGVGGITDKVREVLEGVRESVRNAIRNLIRRVRSLFTGGAGEDAHDPDAAGGGDQELGKNVTFAAGGESHRQWIDLQGTDAVPMVASSPGTVAAKLAEWRGKLDDLPEADRAEAEGLLGRASGALSQADSAADAVAPEFQEGAAGQPAGGEGEAPAPPDDSAVESAQDQLKNSLMRLFELFGEGSRVPFQPVNVPASMQGGSETVLVQTAGEHLSVNVGGGSPVQKLSAISGVVGSARNAAGRTLVEGARTAVDAPTQAIEAVAVTGGLVRPEDAETAHSKAQEIATAISGVGTTMGIGTLDRGTRVEPIDPAVSRVFSRLVAENATLQAQFDTEFDRQLTNQQNGLNALTIDAWIVNFDSYGLDEATYRTLEDSARAAVLAELRRRAQQKIATPRVRKQKWQEALTAIDAVDPADPNAVPDFSKLAVVTARFDNLSEVWRENRALIRQLILAGKTQWDGIDSRFAILHNADQIAGGAGQIDEFDVDPPVLGPNPTPAEEQAWESYVVHMQTLVGPANINSSIGSQWKQATDALRADVTAARPPHSWAIWRLNLALSA
jgi:hypothetical protein